jgi:hypothetical protein
MLMLANGGDTATIKQAFELETSCEGTEVAIFQVSLNCEVKNVSLNLDQFIF